jgi:hypothetical protein
MKLSPSSLDLLNPLPRNSELDSHVSAARRLDDLDQPPVRRSPLEHQADVHAVRPFCAQSRLKVATARRPGGPRLLLLLLLLLVLLLLLLVLLLLLEAM